MTWLQQINLLRQLRQNMLFPHLDGTWQEEHDSLGIGAMVWALEHQVVQMTHSCMCLIFIILFYINCVSLLLYIIFFLIIII